MILQNSVGWFNHAAATCIKFKKPTVFILSSIHKFFFLRHAFSPSGLLFLWPQQAKQTVFLVVYIKPLVQDQTVQIKSNVANIIKINLPLWNPSAVLPTCLQRKPRSLLFALEPKEWIS